jgi:O-antigen ligase
VFLPVWEDTFIRPKVIMATLLLAASLLAHAVSLARNQPPLADPWPGMAWAVGAFAATNLTAFALSVNRAQSLFGEPLQHQGLVSVLLYLGFFWAARSAFRTERQVAHLLQAVATGAAIVVAYALVQRAGLDPIWDRPRGTRVFSTIGQPNALAAYLVMTIPITVALARRTSHTAWRVAALAAATASTLAVAFTKSRGGYIGLAVVAVALLVGMIRSRVGHHAGNKRRGTVASVGVVLAIVLAPVVSAAAGDVWSRTVGGFRGDSIRQHLALWEVGLAIAADHPWFGAGQETFPLLFPEYEKILGPEAAESLRPYRPESPHNVYVAVAAGAGFPALVAYLTVVLFTLTSLWRGIGRPESADTAALRVGIGVALLGHLATDAFMTQDITGSWVVWVLMGAGVGLVRGSDGPHRSVRSTHSDSIDA